MKFKLIKIENKNQSILCDGTNQLKDIIRFLEKMGLSKNKIMNEYLLIRTKNKKTLDKKILNILLSSDEITLHMEVLLEDVVNNFDTYHFNRMIADHSCMEKINAILNSIISLAIKKIFCTYFYTNRGEPSYTDIKKFILYVLNNVDKINKENYLDIFDYDRFTYSKYETPISNSNILELVDLKYSSKLKSLLRLQIHTLIKYGESKDAILDLLCESDRSNTNSLKERNFKIVYDLLFVEDKTLTELSKKYNLTPETIRRVMHYKARKLRWYNIHKTYGDITNIYSKLKICDDNDVEYTSILKSNESYIKDLVKDKDLNLLKECFEAIAN